MARSRLTLGEQERTEESEVLWVDAEGLQPFCEGVAHREAEARHHEGHARRRFGGFPHSGLRCHPNILRDR